MGIAGPGDPFANPEETMETFAAHAEVFPENDPVRGDEWAERRRRMVDEDGGAASQPRHADDQCD